MRPVFLLLLLLAIALLPAPSQAQSPHVVLLGCDTLSTNPLQIHVQYGVQVFGGGYVCWIEFDPQNAGTHILSCSTTVPGASCTPYGPIVVWGFPTCIDAAQSLGTFEFVTDQSPAC